MTKVLFMVWDDQDQYWKHYVSLEDAVSDNEEGTWIYKAKPEYFGRFKVVPKIVRIKK